MKRLMDYHLAEWKNSPIRRPLFLRGARQVGKTYSVRTLASTFSSFVEINFEANKKARTLFNDNLNPHRILQVISAITEKNIVPGETLLFFDEIQTVPEAILALRYFYEEIPELHVIAAGSLLDFTIEKVGIPVGRVQFLYMLPLSFMEFLSALGKNKLIEHLLEDPLEEKTPTLIHETLLKLLSEYLAVGGMPQVVECWRTTQNLNDCMQILQFLAEAYKYDFVKYAKSHQLKYLELLFSQIPHQLGKKFKYSLIGEYKKRELEPCVQLLQTAGIINDVTCSDGQGIPLGSEADPNTFKLLFIDVALTQLMLEIKPGDWLLNPLTEFANKGLIAESLVGQEILSYEKPTKKAKLYYWKRDARGSEAEVDYLIQLERAIIPVEVKSGKGTAMKSMHLFLDNHTKSPYGIRFSTHPYSVHEKIHSYPLYAIARVLSEHDIELRKALASLISSSFSSPQAIAKGSPA